MTVKRVLALSRDRGSMQAIIPVIKSLRDDAEIEVAVVSMEVSRTLLEGEGIVAEYLGEDRFARAPEGCVAEALKRLKPNLILSGSSPAKGPLPETPEQYAIIEGCRRGIPTLAVLDFWGMYLERFSPDGVRASPDFIPDRLCVLDQRCRMDLARLAVPDHRMSVTHNPWMDAVAMASQSPPPPPPLFRDVTGLRALLVSQPLRETQHHRRWPYDQFDLLRLLLHALPESGGKHRVVVWPHPLEHRERWDAKVFSLRGSDMVVAEERGAEYLAHADLVVSSHSTLMYEALYHCTPCLSLRPGASDEPPPMDNSHGLLRQCFDADSLRRYLALFDPAAARAKLRQRKKRLMNQQLFFSLGGATAAVAGAARGMLRGQKGVNLL